MFAKAISVLTFHAHPDPDTLIDFNCLNLSFRKEFKIINFGYLIDLTLLT